MKRHKSTVVTQMYTNKSTLTSYTGIEIMENRDTEQRYLYTDTQILGKSRKIKKY